MVIATMVPEIGRVKNTVQSLEKLIIVFMNDSSAIGPRITPSTSAGCGRARAAGAGSARRARPEKGVRSKVDLSGAEGVH